MARQELYSTPQAAAYLMISSVTLHRAVKRGIISPAMVTPGGNLRFSPEELDRYIRESVANVRLADKGRARVTPPDPDEQHPA